MAFHIIRVEVSEKGEALNSMALPRAFNSIKVVFGSTKLISQRSFLSLGPAKSIILNLHRHI